MRYDIGSFRTRARVMECRRDGGNFAWTPVGSFWCRREKTGVNRLFSRVGLSAEGWDFYMRARPLTLHNLLEAGGDSFFICGIGKPENGYMTVETARVRVSVVTGNAEREESERFTFPAVFTELYIKHSQEEPMSVNVIDRVFVTPKAVLLRPGSLARAENALYEVLTAHTLDEAKNEYTVRRRKEL